MVRVTQSPCFSFDFHRDAPAVRLMRIIGGDGAGSLLSLPHIYCSLTHLEVFNMDKPRKVDRSSKPQTLLSYGQAHQGDRGCTSQEQLHAVNTCHQLPACPCHPSICRPVIRASPPLGQPLLLPGQGSVPAWGCLPGKTGEGLRRQRQRSCIK